MTVAFSVTAYLSSPPLTKISKAPSASSLTAKLVVFANTSPTLGNTSFFQRDKIHLFNNNWKFLQCDLLSFWEAVSTVSSTIGKMSSRNSFTFNLDLRVSKYFKIETWALRILLTLLIPGNIFSENPN